ncbi:MAG: hypothetical protein HY593_04125 [Candidatus Omnitrophica bacterium]|nr:hypothetical protein [Candidatus Omnitrophota bacterium]
MREHCPCCGVDSARWKDWGPEPAMRNWFRCLMCGLVFNAEVSFPPPLSSIDLVGRCVVCKALAERLLRRAARWVRGRRLLDLSAACSHFALRACELGWQAHHNDWNGSDSFDLIVIRQWLDRLAEPHEGAEAVRKKLRPGGLLVALGSNAERFLANRASLPPAAGGSRLCNQWSAEAFTRLFGPYGIGGEYRISSKPAGYGVCHWAGAWRDLFVRIPMLEFIARG